MKKFLSRSLASVVLLLSLSGVARATPTDAHLTFKFFAFTITNPQGTVQGYVDVSVDNLTGTLLGISGANFEIAGAHYTTPSQFLFGVNGSGLNYITSSVNAPGILLAQTDDFYFTFGNYNSFNHSYAYNSLSFRYTTTNAFGAYEAFNWDPLQVTLGGPTQLPPNNLPDTGGTVTALGLSALAFAFARRWLKAVA